VDADGLYTLLKKKRPCEQWLRSEILVSFLEGEVTRLQATRGLPNAKRYQIFYCEDERQNTIEKMELFIYTLDFKRRLVEKLKSQIYCHPVGF